MARGLLSGEGLQRLHELTDPGELHLVRTLVGHGLCPEHALVGALADHWELGRVDLSRSEVDLMPLVVLSRNEAVAHLVLPFSASGLKLHVAVASPEAAAEIAPELAKRSGLQVQLYLASLSDLLRTIAGAYEAAQRGQRAFQGPDFPKNASRSSLQACAITPYRGAGEPDPLPEVRQRPASSRGAWGAPPTGSYPTPSAGSQRTPSSVPAVRRPPHEDLVRQPAVRHEALANDIASALAELAPDAPAPLIAPPPPPPAPEATPAPEPEETRTGLRLLAHKIKVVANTEVPLPFKRTQTGQHKAVTSAGKTPPSSVKLSTPDVKKTVPQSARLATPTNKE